MSFIALALAAGLAAPASAATWKIEFFDPLNDLVGTGTFTADVPMPGENMLASNWTSTVNGITYLKQPSDPPPRLVNFGGEIVAAFTLSPEGNVMGLAFLGGTFIEFPDGPLGIWTTFSGGVFSPRGTYTLTELKEGDPEPPVVPLPATAALLPLGLVALGALRRRKTG